MALAAYADLISAVADWMARNSINADRANDFIALAEADFNRVLRVTSMEKRAATTIEAGDAYLSMPTNCLGLRVLTHDTTPFEELQYVTSDWMRTRLMRLNMGRPKFYAQFGSEFQLGPLPDQDYDFEAIYYERIPALTSLATSNWLLDRNPDIYLFGALVQCALFYQNDALLARYQPLLQQKLDDLRASEQTIEFNGSPLQTRVS
ncbi:phage adaptor protein [Inquilinus limosus]|uniref:Uncharacterized protein n=1 Tax=Inquilinus limosus TaxID=171674 RepID=A0A211ZQA5_9PROT|nr:hypothetical protein [Inquilinus limosus]OWJ67445.1 hypothetical protein BWR60_09575 [Inquilinus limosus]